MPSHRLYAQILNLAPVVCGAVRGRNIAAIAAGNAPGANYSGLYAGLGSVLGAVASNYNYGGSPSGGSPQGPTYSGGNLSPNR